MTLGMRLHALVMAAAEGCRCFGLSYDPKVSHLMADLDLPGFDLNPQAVGHRWPDNPEQMTQTWLEVYANGDPLAPEQIASRVDRALMHRDLLRDVLTPLAS
jgi:polysaccharide pyruvyl transferase WcaK-like protein